MDYEDENCQFCQLTKFVRTGHFQSCTALPVFPLWLPLHLCGLDKDSDRRSEETNPFLHAAGAHSAMPILKSRIQACSSRNASGRMAKPSCLTSLTTQQDKRDTYKKDLEGLGKAENWMSKEIVWMS